MLDNLGGMEIVVLMLVALFVIGPERLPKVLQGLGRGVRKVRQMARNATEDISRETGTDIDINDLNPKAFIRKHVLSEEDEELLTNPIRSALDDVKQHTKPLRDELDETAAAIRSNGSSSSRDDTDDDDDEPAKPAARKHSYDLDAT
ncbi:MAG TPA: twin-arginine translocase TatA/TatE family subunit [Stackebrandtia sp.]|jgi:sec-independent protein translocase protein TatB|uniref:twin-arginine translocase TatA/TatE family subunit n=1 Tax=Stackebrandtia sp. TaxID=2023065 RepID=UPI002D4CA70A|nr:twin-arginine translocase TatA/TatE family subunit [Stackebrandtia sp.]HZE38624.1 twin-arginine translocase TatA/TatE family subunit [Stackebrandtia sp.]